MRNKKLMQLLCRGVTTYMMLNTVVCGNVVTKQIFHNAPWVEIEVQITTKGGLRLMSLSIVAKRCESSFPSLINMLIRNRVRQVNRKLMYIHYSLSVSPNVKFGKF